MSEFSSTACTAFEGVSRIASGPLSKVALAVKTAIEKNPAGSFLTFDDATGRVVDLDLRGSDRDVLARLEERSAPAGNAGAQAAGRGRGRPKLGVVAREVTLLPRHWDWLAAQPGGASPALRRLVDQARGADRDKGSARAAQENAHRFMSAMAGNFPGFEEASRALFAGDREKLQRETAGWPADVRDHALKLAGGS